jgi:hypothetical protein
MTEDAVLNEHDASLMLLALSGREARCGSNRGLMYLKNRSIAAGKRLEFVKDEIRRKKLQKPPRMGNKQVDYWLRRNALQNEVVSLEAMLVNLEAEIQFLAANRYAFSQHVHTPTV